MLAVGVAAGPAGADEGTTLPDVVHSGEPALEMATSAEGTFEATHVDQLAVQKVTQSAPVAQNATSGGKTSATSEDAGLLEETVHLEHHPDQPGEFEAVVQYAVPDVVTELEVQPVDGDVISKAGFEETPDGSYEWGVDDSENGPELRLALKANRTDIGHHERGQDTDHAHPHERGDGYTFGDTGEWGIVAVPQLNLAWSQTEAVGTTQTVTVEDQGIAGSNIAVFGPTETHETTVEGETITLAVPEAAENELEATPGEILDVLATASETMRVGGQSDDVLVVAAPTDGIDWGPEGIQYGEHDAWVKADAPLEAANNVWLHEYVHTRQAYANGEVDTAHTWLIEAQAEYYAATNAYDQGLIEYDELERFLAEGQETPYAQGVLAEPSTWHDEHTDYVKGPLAYAAVDRDLRLTTDGEHTLEDVFADLNSQEGAIEGDHWLDTIEALGGSDGHETAERYAYTDAVPDTWDESAHEAAFGQPTPVIHATPHPGEPLAIDGLLEERTVETFEPIHIGETLTVPLEVSNDGDRDGPYRTALRVDGVEVDDATGTLEAGETITESVAWTPEEPGRYTLHAGDSPLTIDVLTPAEPTVTGLEVTPTEAEPGDTITVTATVDNTADRIGETTLEFRTGAGTITEERVVLEPGDTETVETTTSFDQEAIYEIAVGDEETTVTVERDLGSQAAETVDELPGFGAVQALSVLGALLLATVIDKRRRQGGH